MDYVRLEEVLDWHARIKRISVASARDHVHRMDLFQSALERPRNADAYEDADLVRQAATLLWGLVRSHPFVDGNKRTAYVVTRAFLQLNAHDLEMTTDERFELVIGIANGSLTVEQAEELLRPRVRPAGR